MQIANFKKESFVDYVDKISTIAFAAGCNYKCPTCHAKHIVNSKENKEKQFFDYLDEVKDDDWMEGVVLCGGEPTIHYDLPEFLEKIKKIRYLVKLDTNGRNYMKLIELKERGLVDYVAMDIKGPLRLYSLLTGMKYIDERDDVGKGIGLVCLFPDYEYRTTIVPIIDNKIRWISPEEARDAARLIYDFTGNREHKYFLQKFVAREKEAMIDERFSKENLPEEFWETPDDLMNKCLEATREILPNTKLR